jgi:hypothetical protein
VDTHTRTRARICSLVQARDQIQCTHQCFHAFALSACFLCSNAHPLPLWTHTLQPSDLVGAVAPLVQAHLGFDPAQLKDLLGSLSLAGDGGASTTAEASSTSTVGMRMGTAAHTGGAAKAGGNAASATNAQAGDLGQREAQSADSTDALQDMSDGLIMRERTASATPPPLAVPLSPDTPRQGIAVLPSDNDSGGLAPIGEDYALD